MSGRQDWLPDELTRAQPYSMGPTLRWAPPQAVPQLQGNGIGRMEHGYRRWIAGPERSIVTCLVAPRSIQMQARKDGVNAVMMIRPRGIELVDPRLESTHDRGVRLARERLESERAAIGFDAPEESE